MEHLMSKFVQESKSACVISQKKVTSDIRSVLALYLFSDPNIVKYFQRFPVLCFFFLFLLLGV